jgi:hypothetical protein
LRGYLAGKDAVVEGRIPMIRHVFTKRGRVTLALAAAVAGPVAYAQAHNTPEPTVNGPDKLGAAYAGSGKAPLPGVTLDCPPPEAGPICHITVVVKSRKPLRLRKGGTRKVRTIAKLRYDLEANRDLADIWPAPLTAAGTKALNRFGTVKARAHVTNVIGPKHRAARDFLLTVHTGYPPGAKR